MKQILTTLIIGCLLLLSCQAITLQGTVINEKMEPVPGAKVIVKRSGQSALTDKRGKVTIQELHLFDTLIVVAEGYQTQEVPNNERGLVTVILEQQ